MTGTTNGQSEGRATSLYNVDFTTQQLAIVITSQSTQTYTCPRVGWLQIGLFNATINLKINNIVIEQTAGSYSFIFFLPVKEGDVVEVTTSNAHVYFYDFLK